MRLEFDQDIGAKFGTDFTAECYLKAKMVKEIYPQLSCVFSHHGNVKRWEKMYQTNCSILYFCSIEE